MSAPTPSPASPGEDRLLALLVLLPAAVLAWPGESAPLLHDAWPHVAGTGWIALAAAPLAAFLAWRRRFAGSPALVPLLVFVLWGFVAVGANAATDAFEARRALAHGCAALVLFAGGAALGAPSASTGRKWLAGGALVLSAVWTAGALARGDGYAGVLGNSGALGQAALPGAVCGAWLLVAGHGRTRVLGAVVHLLFAAHAGVAPVLAGMVSAAAAFVVSALLAPRLAEGAARPWARRAALLALAVLPAGVWLGWRALPSAGSNHWEVADVAAGDTSGLEVRALLWQRAPSVLAEHPLLGVGPGQLHADFPPHRDPEEIRLSNHGSCEDHTAEIDHLHQDWLQGLVEGGLVGGLAWVVFLALALSACASSLRSSELARAALGAAGIALLVNATAHSPFLFHPASAALAFPLFGAVSARRGHGAGRGARLGFLVLVPALFAAWTGGRLVAHGAALTRAFRAAEVVAHAAEAGVAAAGDAEAAAKSFARAFELADDFVPVLHLRARDAARVDPELAIASYRDVLLLRPHDPTAWQQIGTLNARLGRQDEARASWLRVLADDPGHPKVLRNLVQLEVDAGDPEAANRRLDELVALGCLDPEWLDAFVLHLLFAGRGEAAFPLLARRDSRYAEPYGELVDAIRREHEAADEDELALALESAAHHLYARDHVTAEAWSNAIRSYRQALRPTTHRWDGGAPLLRCEKAACEVLDGRLDEAERTLAGLARDPLTWKLLAPWARSVLEERGLYGPE